MADKIGRKQGLKNSAKKFVSRFAKDGQVDHEKTNLGHALVLTTQAQQQQAILQETLNQRWWDTFAEDDSKVRIRAEPGNEQLDEVTRRVGQAWNRFQKSLPKEQQADLRDKPPDLQFLREAVASANKALEKNKENSTTKKRFEKICKTFDDYKDLGGVIPSGDKYICLVTGSLGALITATVNHADVASAISQALVDISEDISYWGRLIKQHPVNDKMRGYIRELYASVFECFADVFTQWQKSSWTRIAKSFNRNSLFEIVERHRDHMRKITEYLEREVRLEHGQYMSDISKYATDSAGEFARIHDKLDAFEEMAMQGFFFVPFEQQKLLVAGMSAENTLHENFFQRLNQTSISTNRAAPTERLATLEIEELQSESGSESSAGGTYTKSSVQDAVRSAGFSLSETTPVMPLIAASELDLGPLVFQALQEWTKSASSTSLWIEGPYDEETPSLNTLISVSLVGVAQKSRTPFLAFFGQPPTGRHAADRAKSCSENLVALVYTLISQIVNQLPESFESDIDFSTTRFERLDKSISGIGPAMLVLRDLLTVYPRDLLCFVDGLQYLTYGTLETKRAIKDLVEILCSDSSARGHLRKVLFTTDGYLELLAKATKSVRLNRVTHENEDGDNENTLDDLL